MGVQVTERQLHLFKSRRQRGIAPPAPLEFASQAFLVDILRRWINPQWRFCHVPNGELRSAATAGRLQRLGVVAGWPDLQFAGPGARMAFLELKRRGSGRLSESQQAMRDHLEARIRISVHRQRRPRDRVADGARRAAIRYPCAVRPRDAYEPESTRSILLSSGATLWRRRPRRG